MYVCEGGRERDFTPQHYHLLAPAAIPTRLQGEGQVNEKTIDSLSVSQEMRGSNTNTSELCFPLLLMPRTFSGHSVSLGRN